MNVEMDKPWRLMQKIKKSYRKERQTINNKTQLTMKDCKGKMSGRLQHKSWKPIILKAIVVGQTNNVNDQLQCKVWEPQGAKSLKVYDHEVIFLFLWESDARSSSLNSNFKVWSDLRVMTLPQ